MIPEVTSLARFARRPHQLVSSWPPGDHALAPRVAIFAHFDPLGAVHEHTVRYLESLAQAGLCVVFVSNAGRLTPDALARLRPVCATILVRRNVGYDFGAWREAMEVLGLPRPDTEMLILANDSVYGPLRPLSETLDRIRFTEAPVWGLTESWQKNYHLQSYFLAFAPPALQSESWARFWRQVRPAPSKHWIIRHYEVGLTQTLMHAGLPCKAVWPSHELLRTLCDDPANGTTETPPTSPTTAHARQTDRIRTCHANGQHFNPTADLWRQLLQAGYPFIKRELLCSNPTRVADQSDWPAVVRQSTGADIDPILRDLHRPAGPRAKPRWRGVPA